ncbi:MAG: O-antigen ligase family protein [Bacteroidaceae bacterium]|nr:O-antigen ligase family protein [Bacteroidaceae bacterium]
MGYMLYVSAFIVSLISHGEFKLKNISNCPVYPQLTIVFISCLLIGLFDERMGPVTGMWRSVQYFMKTFLLFVFGWLSLDGNSTNNGFKRNKKNLFAKLLPITLIITVYGLITAVTKSNPILDAVGLEDRFLFEDDESYRAFRVTGANVSSSVYGLTCGLFFMCCCFLKKKQSKLSYVALGLLFINVFLSATRAAMIPFIVGLALFIILNKGLSKGLKYVIIAAISATLIYPILPQGIKKYSSELVASIEDVLLPSGTGGEEFYGSSIEKRDMQIAASMTYLKKKPLFGHGINYASEVILKGEKHDELLGMESYLCFIGIELGLVYAVAIVIFFIACLIYFIKNRKYAVKYADIGTTSVVMYILFLIYAWVGNAWFIMMPILGYIMKYLYLEKESLIQKRNSNQLSQ